MENAFSLIFAFLVEAVILLQYASRLFSPKRSLPGRLAVLSLIYICLCATAFFNIKWLNMLLYLFANFLFLVTQYDVRWRAAAFHSALLAAVMGMCELIVYGIISRTIFICRWDLFTICFFLFCAARFLFLQSFIC